MESKNSTIIYFNTRDELVRVDLRQVVFFKADKNYTEIYFINGQTTIVSYNLGVIAQLLNEDKIKDKMIPFLKLGRSIIINPAYVFKINTVRQELILGEMSQTKLYKLALSKDILRKLKDIYSNK